MSEEAARRGVTERVFASWRAPRLEMRRLLSDRPAEAVLLSFLMIAALLGVAGRLLDHAATPWDPQAPAFVAAWESRYAEMTGEDPAALSPEARLQALSRAMDDKLTRDRLEMLIGAFLVFPLGLYLLAALVTPALRAFGGRGGGYETRAAMSWAALTAAPVGLAAQVFLIFGRPPGAVETALGVGVAAFWLYLLSTYLAEAHGFRSRASILGGVLAIIVLLGAISLAVR